MKHLFCVYVCMCLIHHSVGGGDGGCPMSVSFSGGSAVQPMSDR